MPLSLAVENPESQFFSLTYTVVWQAIPGTVDMQNLPGKQEGGICDAQGQRSKLHDTPDTENDR